MVIYSFISRDCVVYILDCQIDMISQLHKLHAYKISDIFTI